MVHADGRQYAELVTLTFDLLSFKLGPYSTSYSDTTNLQVDSDFFCIQPFSTSFRDRHGKDRRTEREQDAIRNAAS